MGVWDTHEVDELGLCMGDWDMYGIKPTKWMPKILHG